jgi:hypothetical protein
MVDVSKKRKKILTFDEYAQSITTAAKTRNREKSLLSNISYGVNTFDSQTKLTVKNEKLP